jgi:hypothetical protein
MRLRFYPDPISGWPHIHNHGVSEEEVEDVLLHPLEDGPARRNARAAIGRTRAGRTLRVIYVPDPVPNSLFVITAYDLTARQLHAFRRRRRRKPRK